MGRSAAPRPVRHPVVLSLLAITSGVLPVFLTGALTVQIRDQLHFAETGLGLLVAVFFLAAVPGSLLGGQISDRGRVGVVMRLGTATSACLLGAIALFAHSLVELGIFLGLAGLTNGLLQPAVNAFLVRAVPPGRQGFAFGVRQSAIPLSTLLGGVAVPALALTFGWRFAYGAAAIVAAGTSLSVPSRHQVAALSGDGHGFRSRRERRPSPRVHLPPLLVLGAAAGLGAGAANALGAFLVSGAVAARISPALAGWLAAGGSLCGLLARVGVGAQADRRSGGHLKVVATMLVLGGAGYGLLATERAPLMVPGAMLAFAAGWGWNGLFNYAVARTHPAAPAKATAVTQAGVYAGSVVVPLVFGLVVGHLSYGAAWLGAAVLVVAAAGVMVLGRRWLVASADGSPGRASLGGVPVPPGGAS